MGWFPVFLGIITSLLFWRTGNNILLILSLASAVGAFWSWGIMHNYATGQAKKRNSYSGGFFDFTYQEAQSVPNWITHINMIFSLLALIMLIVAVTVRLF